MDIGIIMILVCSWIHSVYNQFKPATIETEPKKIIELVAKVNQILLQHYREHLVDLRPLKLNQFKFEEEEKKNLNHLQTAYCRLRREETAVKKLEEKESDELINAREQFFIQIFHVLQYIAGQNVDEEKKTDLKQALKLYKTPTECSNQELIRMSATIKKEIQLNPFYFSSSFKTALNNALDINTRSSSSYLAVHNLHLTSVQHLNQYVKLQSNLEKMDLHSFRNIEYTELISDLVGFVRSFIALKKLEKKIQGKTKNL